MNKSRFSPALTAVLLLSFFCGAAQRGFRYRARLDHVPRSGFYKIDLPRRVLAHASAGYANLRILDGDSIQVPYITQTSVPVISPNNFHELRFKKVESGSIQQAFLLEKASLPELDHLVVTSRNILGTATLRLSTSSDGVHWRDVTTRLVVQDVRLRDTAYLHLFTFLAIRPRFARILVAGTPEQRLNVLKIGTLESRFGAGVYEPVPIAKVSESSRQGTSYLTLEFSRPYDIAKLQLDLKGPRYFRRPVSISPGSYELTDTGIFASNDRSNTFYLNHRTSKLFVTIRNGDSPPLQVANVRVWQLKTYLIAYLNAGVEYHLYFGDETMRQPDYDLALFRDSIRNPVQIGVTDVETLPLHLPEKVPEEKVGRPVLWIVTSIVGILLLYFTIRMTREITRRSQEPLDS